MKPLWCSECSSHFVLIYQLEESHIERLLVFFFANCFWPSVKSAVLLWRKNISIWTKPSSKLIRTRKEFKASVLVAVAFRLVDAALEPGECISLMDYLERYILINKQIKWDVTNDRIAGSFRQTLFVLFIFFSRVMSSSQQFLMPKLSFWRRGDWPHVGLSNVPPPHNLPLFKRPRRAFLWHGHK